MMDFYSMEKIAFAKLVEDHKIAAASHLADEANVIRLAGRRRSGLSPVGLIRRLARTLTHPVTWLVPTTQASRAKWRRTTV